MQQPLHLQTFSKCSIIYSAHIKSMSNIALFYCNQYNSSIVVSLFSVRVCVREREKRRQADRKDFLGVLSGAEENYIKLCMETVTKLQRSLWWWFGPISNFSMWAEYHHGNSSSRETLPFILTKKSSEVSSSRVQSTLMIACKCVCVCLFKQRTHFFTWTSVMNFDDRHRRTTKEHLKDEDTAEWRSSCSGHVHV